MPLTSKEKVARFRALKENPERYQQHLEKERLRDKKRRCEVKNQLKANTAAARKKLQKVRQQQNERQALCRLQRRNSDQLGLQQTEANTYKSPQALGKALVRARKALPHSPRKRKTVLTHLTKDIHDLSSQSTQKSHALSIPTSTENKVREFYQNDEISWQAPGRKDFVRVGNLIQPKENVQKKIMLMTIDEAFESFKTVHPEVQIGRSSFFKLRPANVKPSSDMPHNVCVCRYHAYGDGPDSCIPDM